MTRTVIAELAADPVAMAAEYIDLCHELGCVVKAGAALKFAKDLRRRLGEAHAREVELIRMWDPASPTERQELDRMRRGWGPSSPTERERRRGDVAGCLQVLSIAMSDLTVGEDKVDDVPEEARDRLDEAYDRISKQHAAIAGILHALVADPQEWPDIVAAEERGEARALRSISEGRGDRGAPEGTGSSAQPEPANGLGPSGEHPSRVEAAARAIYELAPLGVAGKPVPWASLIASDIPDWRWLAELKRRQAIGALSAAEAAPDHPTTESASDV